MLRDVNPNRCTDEQLPICLKGKFDFAVLDPSVCPDYGAQNVKDEIIDLSADQLAQLSQACEEELRLKCKYFKDVSRSIRRRQRVDVMQTDSKRLGTGAFMETTLTSRSTFRPTLRHCVHWY
jgi:hypothetical protein